MLKLLNRAGWAISAGVALILSAYSLFYVGRAWGMPPVLAGMVSLVLDGAAIVSADMALRANKKHGHSGIDRWLTVVFAGLSAWINSYHARIVHAGGAAWALYALPPVVAVVLFDRHTRNERQAATRKSGRVLSPLPRIKKEAWLLYPIASFKILRAMVGSQLQDLRPGQPVSSNDENIRAWARAKGLDVGEKGRIAAPIWAAWEKEKANGNHQKH